jgi:hypothetical protein
MELLDLSTATRAAMNSAELWTEPKKPRSISPQAFAAIGLLAILLIGTSGWQNAGAIFSSDTSTFSATNSR